MNQSTTTDLQSAITLFTSLQIAKAVNGQKFIMPEISQGSNLFSWVAEEDEKVCQECKQKSQTIYTLTGVATLQPAHPNCRCEVVPLVGIKADTLTSIAPNYLIQKNGGTTGVLRDTMYNKKSRYAFENGGTTGTLRDTIYNTKSRYAFEYDNADGRLPCEVRRK